MSQKTTRVVGTIGGIGLILAGIAGGVSGVDPQTSATAIQSSHSWISQVGTILIGLATLLNKGK